MAITIEETIKQFELELTKKVADKRYKDGIVYALGMVNKHLKYKTDCEWYGNEVYHCKRCDYMCDRYQEKEILK